MSLRFRQALKLHQASELRGDTIIEVMFAITIFCLVAVISISMMDLGVASAENSLETVVARNELNAQAEALRFVHSSYISEKTLPLASEITESDRAKGVAYQQYQPLWDKIVANAITPTEAETSGLLNLAHTVTNNTGGTGAVGCDRIYDTSAGENLLSRSKAFVINTRNLSSLTATGQIDVDISYMSASAAATKADFVAAPLGARIIFEKNDDTTTDSTTQFTDGGALYDRIKLAEGIWIIAVTDGTSVPTYYDFYIEACWNGPHAQTPITQDTVIRLYNPENV